MQCNALNIVIIWRFCFIRKKVGRCHWSGNIRRRRRRAYPKRRQHKVIAWIFVSRYPSFNPLIRHIYCIVLQLLTFLFKKPGHVYLYPYLKSWINNYIFFNKYLFLINNTSCSNVLSEREQIRLMTGSLLTSRPRL